MVQRINKEWYWLNIYAEMRAVYSREKQRAQLFYCRTAWQFWKEWAKKINTIQIKPRKECKMYCLERSCKYAMTKNRPSLRLTGFPAQINVRGMYGFYCRRKPPRQESDFKKEKRGPVSVRLHQPPETAKNKQPSIKWTARQQCLEKEMWWEVSSPVVMCCMIRMS